MARAFAGALEKGRLPVAKRRQESKPELAALSKIDRYPLRFPPLFVGGLASALHEHERAGSVSSPFRSRFYRPGLKYINRLNSEV